MRGLTWYKGILPHIVTLASILKACVKVGTTSKGRQVCDEISRQGLPESDIVMDYTLLYTYAKCAAISKA